MSEKSSPQPITSIDEIEVQKTEILERLDEQAPEGAPSHLPESESEQPAADLSGEGSDVSETKEKQELRQKLKRGLIGALAVVSTFPSAITSEILPSVDYEDILRYRKQRLAKKFGVDLLGDERGSVHLDNAVDTEDSNTGLASETGLSKNEKPKLEYPKELQSYKDLLDGIDQDRVNQLADLNRVYWEAFESSKSVPEDRESLIQKRVDALLAHPSLRNQVLSETGRYSLEKRIRERVQKKISQIVTERPAEADAKNAVYDKVESMVADILAVNPEQDADKLRDEIMSIVEMPDEKWNGMRDKRGLIQKGGLLSRFDEFVDVKKAYDADSVTNDSVDSEQESVEKVSEIEDIESSYKYGDKSRIVGQKGHIESDWKYAGIDFTNKVSVFKYDKSTGKIVRKLIDPEVFHKMNNKQRFE